MTKLLFSLDKSMDKYIEKKELIMHSYIGYSLEQDSWDDGPKESYKKYCKTCTKHGFMVEHDNFSHDSVYCDRCSEMLHLGAVRNKNQKTWVETGKGNFCLKCFCNETNYGESLRDDDTWGLE